MLNLEPRTDLKTLTKNRKNHEFKKKTDRNPELFSKISNETFLDTLFFCWECSLDITRLAQGNILIGLSDLNF